MLGFVSFVIVFSYGGVRDCAGFRDPPNTYLSLVNLSTASSRLSMVRQKANLK